MFSIKKKNEKLKKIQCLNSNGTNLYPWRIDTKTWVRSEYGEVGKQICTDVAPDHKKLIAQVRVIKEMQQEDGTITRIPVAWSKEDETEMRDLNKEIEKKRLKYEEHRSKLWTVLHNAEYVSPIIIDRIKNRFGTRYLMAEELQDAYQLFKMIEEDIRGKLSESEVPLRHAWEKLVFDSLENVDRQFLDWEQALKEYCLAVSETFELDNFAKVKQVRTASDYNVWGNVLTKWMTMKRDHPEFPAYQTVKEEMINFALSRKEQMANNKAEKSSGGKTDKPANKNGKSKANGNGNGNGGGAGNGHGKSGNSKKRNRDEDKSTEDESLNKGQLYAIIAKAVKKYQGEQSKSGGNGTGGGFDGNCHKCGKKGHSIGQCQVKTNPKCGTCQGGHMTKFHDQVMANRKKSAAKKAENKATTGEEAKIGAVRATVVNSDDETFEAFNKGRPSTVGMIRATLVSADCDSELSESEFSKSFYSSGDDVSLCNSDSCWSEVSGKKRKPPVRNGKQSISGRSSGTTQKGLKPTSRRPSDSVPPVRDMKVKLSSKPVRRQSPVTKPDTVPSRMFVPVPAPTFSWEARVYSARASVVKQKKADKTVPPVPIVTEIVDSDVSESEASTQRSESESRAPNRKRLAATMKEKQTASILKEAAIKSKTAQSKKKSKQAVSSEAVPEDLTTPVKISVEDPVLAVVMFPKSPDKQSSSDPSGRPSGTSPGRPSGTSPGRPSGNSPGRPSEKSPGRPSASPSGRPSEIPSGRSSEHEPGRPSESGSGRPSESSNIGISASPPVRLSQSGRPSGIPIRRPSQESVKEPSVAPAPGRLSITLPVSTFGKDGPPSFQELVSMEIPPQRKLVPALFATTPTEREGPMDVPASEPSSPAHEISGVQATMHSGRHSSSSVPSGSAQIVDDHLHMGDEESVHGSESGEESEDSAGSQREPSTPVQLDDVTETTDLTDVMYLSQVPANLIWNVTKDTDGRSCVMISQNHKYHLYACREVVNSVPRYLTREGELLINETRQTKIIIYSHECSIEIGANNKPTLVIRGIYFNEDLPKVVKMKRASWNTHVALIHDRYVESIGQAGAEYPTTVTAIKCKVPEWVYTIIGKPTAERKKPARKKRKVGSPSESGSERAEPAVKPSKKAIEKLSPEAFPDYPLGPKGNEEDVKFIMDSAAAYPYMYKPRPPDVPECVTLTTPVMEWCEQTDLNTLQLPQGADEKVREWYKEFSKILIMEMERVKITMMAEWAHILSEHHPGITDQPSFVVNFMERECKRITNRSVMVENRDAVIAWYRDTMDVFEPPMQSLISTMSTMLNTNLSRPYLENLGDKQLDLQPHLNKTKHMVHNTRRVLETDYAAAVRKQKKAEAEQAERERIAKEEEAKRLLALQQEIAEQARQTQERLAQLEADRAANLRKVEAAAAARAGIDPNIPMSGEKASPPRSPPFVSVPRTSPSQDSAAVERVEYSEHKIDYSMGQQPKPALSLRERLQLAKAKALEEKAKREAESTPKEFLDITLYNISQEIIAGTTTIHQYKFGNREVWYPIENEPRENLRELLQEMSEIMTDAEDMITVADLNPLVISCYELNKYGGVFFLRPGDEPREARILMAGLSRVSRRKHRTFRYSGRVATVKGRRLNVIDSGAALHVLMQLLRLMALVEVSKKYRLTAANGGKMHIEQQGQSPAGHVAISHDGMDNIVSVPQLQDNAFDIDMKGNARGEPHCIITKGNLRIAATRVDNLWVITDEELEMLFRPMDDHLGGILAVSGNLTQDLSPTAVQAGEVEDSDYSVQDKKTSKSSSLPSTELMERAVQARYLHCYMGHPSDHALINALSNGIILNTHLSERDVHNALAWLGPCLSCQVGKTSNANEDKSNVSRPPRYVGHRVYADIYILSEKSSELSIGGYNHMLFAVDGFSGFVHVIPLKSRKEKDIITSFHILIGFYKRSFHKIKHIHTDSETGFIVSRTWLHHQHIKLHVSSPDSHNKRAERYVQTINIKKEAMRAQTPVILPAYLEGELTRAAAYHLNDVPNAQHPTRTPRLIFEGEKVDLGRRKVIPFGTFAIAKSGQSSNVVMVLGPAPLTYGAVSCLQMLSRRIVTRSQIQTLKYIPEHLPSGIVLKAGARNYSANLSSNYRPTRKNSPTDNWNAHYAAKQMMSYSPPPVVEDQTSSTTNMESSLSKDVPPDIPERADSASDDHLLDDRLTVKRVKFPDGHLSDGHLKNKERVIERRHNREKDGRPKSDEQGVTPMVDEDQTPDLIDDDNWSVNDNNSDNENDEWPDWSNTSADSLREGDFAMEGDDSVKMDDQSLSDTDSDGSDSEMDVTVTSASPTQDKSKSKRRKSTLVFSKDSQSQVVESRTSRRKRAQQEARVENFRKLRDYDHSEYGDQFPRNRMNRVIREVMPRKPRVKRVSRLRPSTTIRSMHEEDSGELTDNDALDPRSQDTKSAEGEESFFPAQKDLRRSSRPPKPNSLYRHSYLVRGRILRLSVKQALASDRSQETKEAIRAEIENMNHFKVGHYIHKDDIPEPKKRNIVDCFMFIKHKETPDGLYDKTKARLVGNGKNQKPHMYDLTHSSTVSLASVFLMLNIASYHKCAVSSFDIRGAFLHADFEKEDEVIYIRIPKEIADIWVEMDKTADPYQNKENGTLLLQLEKFIYGLKQSPLKFQLVLIRVLLDLGYERMVQDGCLFIKHEGTDFSILSTHVDDILQVWTSEKLHQELIEGLSKRFAGKDCIAVHKEATSYIGMTIERSACGAFFKLSQKGLVEGCIKYFPKIPGDKEKYYSPSETHLFEPGKDEEAVLLSTKDRALFLKVLMKMMYLARLTRTDVLMPVTFLASHTHCANVKDLKSISRVIRYLENTIDQGIVIHCTDLSIYCWVDASFSIELGRGHTGYVISLGKTLSYLHARSGKQKVGSTSSTEAEVIAMVEAAKMCLWLREVLRELRISPLQPIIIYEDSQSCIKLVNKDPEPSNQSRHYMAKQAFILSLIRQGVLWVQYLASKEMTADVLTKPLHGIDFYNHVIALMGLIWLKVFAATVGKTIIKSVSKQS